MRKVVHTAKAPQPVGPYSQGIHTENLVFTAGQIAIDPATGGLVEGGVEAQTRQALENLRAVLEAAGTDLSRVVKATVFLGDMADFGKVNEVYAEFFASEPPARSAFQVAALPLNALVEIEVVAIVEPVAA